ncbi:hypothetical protein EDD18DRAFT_683975 [Armillaria luteobubalina]|uniref:Uncharacterized protein n=1 Tax=Armillaria luteobubalina TaxID=153913 RepID=A0AA39QH60_9AGAR|nr:hypothetical protein EDD18DRAFT_683975 [Armillaria luteobubalina]
MTVSPHRSSQVANFFSAVSAWTTTSVARKYVGVSFNLNRRPFQAAEPLGLAPTCHDETLFESGMLAFGSVVEVVGVGTSVRIDLTVAINATDSRAKDSGRQKGASAAARQEELKRSLLFTACKTEAGFHSKLFPFACPISWSQNHRRSTLMTTHIRASIYFLIHATWTRPSALNHHIPNRTSPYWERSTGPGSASIHRHIGKCSRTY